MHDITCIIPTFNDAVRTHRAVESALSQSGLGVRVQVLLVDDGSQADTLGTLQALASTDERIQLHRLPSNAGQSVARNVGAMLAQSTHICFLDQDDQHAPGWYQVGLDYLQSHPQYAAISGTASFIDIPERLQVDANDLRLRGLSFVFATNVIFRRTAFLACGGFPVGQAWRGPNAGEDGALRAEFFRAFQCIHAFVPALIHTIKEGGATAFFLDHSRVENEQVLFTSNSVESLVQAYADYARRFQDNQQHLRGALAPANSDTANQAQAAAPDSVWTPNPLDALDLLDPYAEALDQLLEGMPGQSAQGLAGQTLSNQDKARAINAPLELYRHFEVVDPLCIKHSSYFQVYEKILRPYVGRRITLVEIGVFNGGSLAMWRRYLGPQARIIGIDLNPQARHWESLGFEIHIGDQASRSFWREFYARVGPVDVLIDDGGHMNHQQSVTVQMGLEHLRDGATLVVEDVHASYLPEFGNPSDDAFVNQARRMVDDINARFPGLPVRDRLCRDRIWSLSFYESMVVMHVDSRRCFESHWISNSGAALTDVDYRHAGLKSEQV